jgi:hypothetical protein
VSPEYGTRTVVTPISAVPRSVTRQLGRPGAVPVASADQAMVEPLMVPSAVPFNFTSPAQLALNEPFAVLPVCSVMFHLKSAQELGVGTRLVEIQLPTSDPFPLGEAGVDPRS